MRKYLPEGAEKIASQSVIKRYSFIRLVNMPYSNLLKKTLMSMNQIENWRSKSKSTIVRKFNFNFDQVVCKKAHSCKISIKESTVDFAENCIEKETK